MALTPQQNATLAAHIAASPDMNTLPPGSDSAFEIAALLNATATPNFYIWRASVLQDEIMQNGFDWVRVDNLSVGKARIWDWMFDNAGTSINPSKANVRAGIAEVWKGTAADNAVRLSVFQHCQTLATRLQKLFATGAGTTTTVDGVGPATTEVWSISYNEVKDAMGW
jgi:hypothetical protein